MPETFKVVLCEEKNRQKRLICGILYWSIKFARREILQTLGFTGTIVSSPWNVLSMISSRFWSFKRFFDTARNDNKVTVRLGLLRRCGLVKMEYLFVCRVEELRERFRLACRRERSEFNWITTVFSGELTRKKQNI